MSGISLIFRNVVVSYKILPPNSFSLLFTPLSGCGGLKWDHRLELKVTKIPH